ncbi:MAG: Uma2 family endonuclease [Anaerolineae bacterium]
MTVNVQTLIPPRPAEQPVEPGGLRIPPLAQGDRLTRREFERRYAAMPYLKKAELIEGVVYMPSPVHASHAIAHSQIITWLGVYCAATPKVKLADNATVRLDPDNVVQPDVLLRLEPEAGGRSHISADDYIEGAPELIVEIATSNAAYDLHDKLRVYRRNRVQEYMVWQMLEGRLDWWRWEEGEYVSLTPNEDGIWASQVFPGLWLDMAAMLNGDLAAVLTRLQAGLASAEHAAFVARIAGAGV